MWIAQALDRATWVNRREPAALLGLLLPLVTAPLLRFTRSIRALNLLEAILTVIRLLVLREIAQLCVKLLNLAGTLCLERALPILWEVGRGTGAQIRSRVQVEIVALVRTKSAVGSTSFRWSIAAVCTVGTNSPAADRRLPRSKPWFFFGNLRSFPYPPVTGRLRWRQFR